MLLYFIYVLIVLTKRIIGTEKKKLAEHKICSQDV